MISSLLAVSISPGTSPDSLPNDIFVVELRHACEQGDGLDRYTWTEYDPYQGGRQVLEDGYNNVRITTEFLKIAGGDHGGSWAARIKGEPIKPGWKHNYLPTASY